ncbi:MAG: hypothetical protein ABIG69_07905, partial [Bacteroidota bacterium]
INEFLPDDKKLPADATGEQAKDAISALPPEQQALVLMKEFDVEIVEAQEFTKVQQALAQADATGASTRPIIAKMMAYCVAFVVLAFSSMWIVAVVGDQVNMMGKLTEAWPLMLAVLGTPTALLRSYFGMRTREKESRYNMATPNSSVPGALSQIIGMFKK